MGVLAQIDVVKPVAEGLGANFLPYALALVIGALLFSVKFALDLIKTHATATAEQNAKHAAALADKETKHAEQIAVLNAKLVERLDTNGKEQRETLMLIIPLVSKLTAGLETIEEQARE